MRLKTNVAPVHHIWTSTSETWSASSHFLWVSLNQAKRSLYIQGKGGRASRKLRHRGPVAAQVCFGP
jgi:hypothetical protein